MLVVSMFSRKQKTKLLIGRKKEKSVFETGEEKRRYEIVI